MFVYTSRKVGLRSGVDRTVGYVDSLRFPPIVNNSRPIIHHQGHATAGMGARPTTLRRAFEIRFDSNCAIIIYLVRLDSFRARINISVNGTDMSS